MSTPEELIAEARARKAKASESSEPFYSPGKPVGAALQGAASGASLGFADEIAGAAKAAIGLGAKAGQALTLPAARAYMRSKNPALKMVSDEAIDRVLSRGVTEGMAGLGVKMRDDVGDTLRDTYRAGRDEMRAAEKEAIRKQRGAHLAGSLAGGLVGPAPLSKLKALEGAAVGTKAAVAGLGSGLAFGAGQSEAELVQPKGSEKAPDVGGLAKDTLAGGAIGAAIAPVVAYASGPATRWLARKLEERSARNALKAAGLHAGISNKLKNLGVEDVDDALSLGRAIRDSGAVTPGSTPAQVWREADEMGKVYGEMIAPTLEAAESRGLKFDPLRAADDARKAAFDRGTNWAQQKGTKAAGMIEGIEGLVTGKNNPESFVAANQLKRELQNAINYKVDDNLTTEQQRNVARALRNAIDEQLRIQGADDLAEQLAVANRRVSLAKDIQKLSSDESTRDLSRQGVSLKDATIGTGIAAAVGGLPGLAAAGLYGAAMAGVKPRLPSLAMAAQHSLSKTLPKAAESARNPLTRLAIQEATRPEDTFAPVGNALDSDPTQLGKFAAAFAGKTAAQRQAIHKALLESSPEYAAMVAGLAR